VVALWGWNVAQAHSTRPTPPLRIYAPAPAWGGSANTGYVPSVSYPYNTGYENPAPGNDGSYDCPPGGGPVYVGSNDPANLDGDGDGIGCEG
jgi:hypothetical protein